MSFDSIRDEDVKRLAQTLRSSGMAGSDTEAIAMAESMVATSGKVQKGYSDYEKTKGKGASDENRPVAEKKAEVVEDDERGAAVPNPEHDSEPEVGSEPGAEVKSEPEAINLDAKNLYEQQKDVVKSSYKEEFDEEKTLNELMTEDASKVYGEQFELHENEQADDSDEAKGNISHDVPPDNAADEVKGNISHDVPSGQESYVDSLDLDQPEELNSQPEKQEKQELPESSSSPSSVAENAESSDSSQKAPEQFKDDDFEVEETKEVESEEKDDEDRKKEIDDMAESKVDLSEVFKF